MGKKRVLKFHALEIPALEGRANFGFLDATFRSQSGDAIRGEQQRALFGFHDDVFEIGMKRERAIVRHRPWSGRPDDRAHVAANFCSSPFPPPTTANFTQIDGLV